MAAASLLEAGGRHRRRRGRSSPTPARIRPLLGTERRRRRVRRRRRGSRCVPTTFRNIFGAVFAAVRATSDDAYRRLDREDARLLCGRALQPALGRADPVSARRRPRDFHGVPGTQSGAGGSGLAPLLRLGRRVAAGLRDRVAPQCHRRARAPFLGPGLSLRAVPGVVDRRRPRRRAAGQYLLGWQSRRGGSGPLRLPVRLAAGVAPRRRPARSPRRRAVCGLEASRRVAAFQQGARGRPRRKRSPRRGRRR